MTLTYFTAIGTYKAATADSTSDVDADPDLVPVFGRVRFTPLIRAGDSIQGTTLTPPSSLLLRPITVPLVGGQVSLNGTTGVRLVANTSALNLTGALVYQVDFFDLQAVSDSLDLRSFSFTAPTVDSIVDLVSVAPVTGTLAGGTTVGPQGPVGPTGPQGPPGPVDVYEFANLAAFPGTGVVAKVYVADDTNKAYRWNGSTYIEVSPSVVTSVNGQTAVVVLAKGDVGLALADNVADVNKPVSTAQAAAIATGVTTAEARANHTGTQSADTIVDGTANKVLSATDKTRLANTSGTNTGDQTSVSGNAGTATKLVTARKINGVSFDGTADITDNATTRVFDARDYGVIADGAQHNNVANLLDCCAQAAAAGAREVLLPAGVIVTSEAALGTVTADSGRTYTNNGGIPLPVNNQAMAYTGHGVGVTVLQLSPGFTRGFDFFYLADGQSYKGITIRGITFDRNNMTASTIAPLTAVTGGVTLVNGSYTTLPGITPAVFKNAKMGFLPATNTGTGKNMVGQISISGGNVQFKNNSGGDLTLVTGDQVSAALWDHVIVGTLYRGGYYNNGFNMSIDNVLIQDCESINVVTTPTNGFSVTPTDHCPNIGIVLTRSPATYTPVPSATNITANRVRMSGGDTGFAVGGQAGTFVDEVWAIDCFHDTMIDPQYNYYSANFNIGARAWVGRVGLIRCKGRRSGDVAYEIDQPWDGLVEECVWEEAFSGCYTTSFVPPARTSSGPPTTTLNNGSTLTLGAATCTMTALPSGVARSGLALIDSELIWYACTSGSTAFSIWRGINGTTAASHVDGSTVTFVETFKTRIKHVGGAIRNKLVMAVAGAGHCFIRYENSSLPHTPFTVRDVSIQLTGGDLLPGQVFYWAGWMPEIDIQGVRVNQDSVVDSNTSGSTGALMTWSWANGNTMFTNSVPILYPRIFGRNNDFRVHGTIVAGHNFSIMRPGPGFALLDMDISGEVQMQGASGGSGVNIVNLTATAGRMVLAPQSRLGIKGRSSSAGGSDGAPTTLFVGPTSGLLLNPILDVDIDCAEMSCFSSGTDANYRPWSIDATQVGNIRFGKIRHYRLVAGQLATAKRLAVAVSANYTVRGDDEIVLVNTASGAVTITIPVSTTGAGSIGEPLSRGRKLEIIDAGFTAATNNITITPASTDKIDNGTAGTSVTINTNGGHKTLAAYAAMPGWVSI